METPLPYTINKASREFDNSKVFSLGPFALAMSLIIYQIEWKHRGGEESSLNRYGAKRNFLYRGLKFDRQTINEWKSNKNGYV